MKTIDPKILYFGTPVILISTLNENGQSNLAPFSSVWWLGKSCMIGMSTRSKTYENLSQSLECVINLPSPDLVWNVNQLALLTGKNPVPDYKQNMGYEYEPNKFEVAGLTKIPSNTVNPPRAKECPVQLEAKVRKINSFGTAEDNYAGIDLDILQVHVEEELIVPGTTSYIDSDKWSPLIMNFTEFYGLSEKLSKSRLAAAFKPYLLVG